MAKQNVILNRFNYGITSPLAFARSDLARAKLGAEIQTNIIGKSLGAGVFRPGLQYVTSTKDNNRARYLPFIYSIDDTALIEITEDNLRILVNESPITRPTVSTAITNGTFASDLTGWTGADETGATSYQSGGFMVLQGTGSSAAKRYQLVAVTGSDIGREHGVRIVVSRGPVVVRIGSTLGGDEYLPETTLESDGYGPGTYSFAIYPDGDFYIEFSNREDYAASLVDTVSIEASGELTLPVPYQESHLNDIRYDQSGDVVYLACDGVKQKKILRYGEKSWGIADYAPNDGPFRLINTKEYHTLTPSGLTGEITLTSSIPYFRESMEGTLFEWTSKGQRTQNTLTATGQATDYVKITGVGEARKFSVTVSGTWSGTLQIQRSISEPGAWAASELSPSPTSNGTYNYDDGDDNSIYYYRVLGFNITSGAAQVTITTGQGSITGVVRALDYTSPTAMICSVLKPLGGTTASDLWSEGAWSDYRGYPTATALHEGRLWWAGRDKIWGSVSDAYESFDANVEGDSGPISVVLGSGPIDRVQWLLPLYRLVLGLETSEKTARSTSLDEPLTPTNFSLKTDSTRGSSPVQAVAIDKVGMFTRNEKVFQLASTDAVSGALDAAEVTLIAPEVGFGGFKRLAVQRYPDTRIHCLRNDGKVALFSFDAYEDVKAWQMIETDGIVQDIVVLPAIAGVSEDRVYYVVQRTVNGSTKRYLEQWAREEDCRGGNLNRMADSWVIKISTNGVISGLDHLEGEDVVVWAGGVDYSPGFGDDQTTYTVSGGSISTGVPHATFAVVGLPYSGTYKSVKLAYAAQMGEALCQRKKVDHIAFILLNTHNKGLQYGGDFETMDDMPSIEDGAEVDSDYVWSEYDDFAIEFPGDWNTDSRVCLRMQAPRPCTITGMVIGVNTSG